MSMQKYVGKVRPPYVQIQYDVQVGDAIEHRELPFVVNVLADLSGASRKHLPRLKKREFVEVRQETFDRVLQGVSPSVKVEAKNCLVDGADDIRANLVFRKLEDFTPAKVAEQLSDGVQGVSEGVKAFKALYELRRKIKNLLLTMDGDDDLMDMLQRLIDDGAVRKQLCNNASPAEGQS